MAKIFELEKEVTSSNEELVIEISMSEIESWCLATTLLATEVEKSVVFRFKNKKLVLSLTTSTEEKWFRIKEQSKDSTKIEIPLNQVEYLQYTLTL